jgi:hypothetical protein
VRGLELAEYINGDGTFCKMQCDPKVMIGFQNITCKKKKSKAIPVTGHEGL